MGCPIQRVWVLLFIVDRGYALWYPSPSFLKTPTNVTVQSGEYAFLPCRVANLGDRSVTWIRKKNLHIISAGVLTYVPDNRYRVLHPENSDEWTLMIRKTRKRDGGWYECQVNCDPKITKSVLLVVKDKNLEDLFSRNENVASDNSSWIFLQGPAERFIQQGSLLSVTCVITHEEQGGPDYVTWYRGSTVLDYDSPRGGISLQTEKRVTQTVSKLMLSSVTPSDSGRYTCGPNSGGYASVIVHIQSDQQQAAVQIIGKSNSINEDHFLKRFFIYGLLYYYIIYTYFVCLI